MSDSCSRELHWVQLLEFSGWFVDSLVLTVRKNANRWNWTLVRVSQFFKQTDWLEWITGPAHNFSQAEVTVQPLSLLCAMCITNKNIKYCCFKKSLKWQLSYQHNRSSTFCCSLNQLIDRLWQLNSIPMFPSQIQKNIFITVHSRAYLLFSVVNITSWTQLYRHFS